MAGILPVKAVSGEKPAGRRRECCDAAGHQAVQ